MRFLLHQSLNERAQGVTCVLERRDPVVELRVV